MRAKNASDIASSDNASTLRGARSAIHSFEKVSGGAAEPPRFGSPSTKRKSYCLTQGAATCGKGSVSSNGFAPGKLACACDHDGRRSANTAVASVEISPPPCDNSTHQCWLERLAFTSRTSRSNGPSAIGAQ